jgi:hypothetical protein
MPLIPRGEQAAQLICDARAQLERIHSMSVRRSAKARLGGSAPAIFSSYEEVHLSAKDGQG